MEGKRWENFIFIQSGKKNVSIFFYSAIIFFA
jgi:hypothetical protein